MNDWNRRQFLGRSLGTAVAWKLAGGAAAAAEVTLDTLRSVADPLLARPAEAIPADENALPLLVRAVERMTGEPELDLELDLAIDAGDADPERVKERDRAYLAWVDENLAALDLLEEAAGKEKLSFGDEVWSDKRFELLQGYRAVQRIVNRHAERCADEGRLDEAARHALNGAKVFRLLRDGGGMLVEYLVACACESVAGNLLRSLAYAPGSDRRLAARLLAPLPADIQPIESVKRSMRTEYCCYLLPELAKLSRVAPDDLFAALLNRKVFESLGMEDEYNVQLCKLEALFTGHPDPFDPVATARLASARYVALLRRLDLPWKVHKAQADDPPAAELAAWPEAFDLPWGVAGEARQVTDEQLAAARKSLLPVSNPIGKRYVESSLVDSKALHTSALTQQAKYQATRLVLALRQYELAEGELPGTLDALVARKILPEVPVDPYSEQEFGYSRAAHTVWSVGRTGKIDADAEYDGGDFRWSLGPTPRPW